MDNETILKLVNAGYTKAEISEMFAGAGSDAGASDSAGNEDAGKIEGDGSEENASKVEEIGTKADVNAALTQLTDTVVNLTATVKAMQAGNVAKAATDSPKAGDKIKAAMDSFIESL